MNMLFGWESTVIEAFRQELTDFIALSRDGEPGRIADGYAGIRAVEGKRIPSRRKRKHED
jgi:hypothetical protein